MIRGYCIHETNRWDGPTEGLVYCQSDSVFEQGDIYFFWADELGYMENYKEWENDETDTVEEIWIERTFAIYHLYNDEKEYLLNSIARWNEVGPCPEFYEEHKTLCAAFHARLVKREPITILKDSEIEWKTDDWYNKERKKEV
jgi:hypothetical protein